MKQQVKKRWYFVVAAVVLLVIITFTPLVTPQGQYKPELWGVPYTLWTGFIIAVALVGLTIYGSTICPGSKKREEAE